MARIINFGVAGFGGRRSQRYPFETGEPVVPTPGIVRTVTPSAVNEGSSVTVSFRLRTEPTGSVTVTAVSDDATALTASPGSFVLFTTSNWDTAQSLTLTAASDIDLVDENVTITLTAASADYVGITSAFTVAVTDVGGMWCVDSTQDFLFTIDLDTGSAAFGTRVGNSTDFGVSEGVPNGLGYHNGSLYMVGNQTDSLYTVNTTTGVATKVGTSTDFGTDHGNIAPIGLASLGGTLYMISRNTGNILWTLDVTAGTATLVGNHGQSNMRSLASDGTNLYGVQDLTNAGQMLRIDNTDATTTNIGPPVGGLDLVNGMAFHKGALYAVRTGNVSTGRLSTIDLANDAATTAVTMSANFGISASVPAGLASKTPGVGGASGSTMGFVTASIPSSVTEGSTATFSVKLNASPSEGSTTAVAVTSNHPNGVTVTGGAALTFDTSNWDTMQTVTLTGAGGGGGIIAQVILEASGGGFDDNVMDMFVRNVPIDDSLIVGAHHLWVGEGRTKNFKVRLSSQPTDDVTVTTTSADSNKVYITAGATHTFTTSNWNANHGIDLYGYADTDAVHEHVDLTLTASGGGNSATAVRTIHIFDDD